MTNLKKHHLLKASPWFMWGLAAFFYFYEVFIQVSPGVMVPELMRAFAVNAAALGNLAAFYFYIYAPMQIPVGVLVDRYGPRLLMTVAAVSCAFGCFLFGTAKLLGTAEIGRLFIGFGSAFAVVSCLKIAAIWFPVKRFALLTGLMVTIGMLGAIGAEAPLAMLVANMGWRGSMLILAIIGLGLSALIWFYIRDKQNPKLEAIQDRRAPLFEGLLQVIKQKQSWFVAIYGGLVFAPTSIFGALWGVPFLMVAYHLDRPVAAGVISMLFIGWVVGGPIGGWISDYINRRLPPLYIASIGSFLTLATVIYVPNLSLLHLNLLLFAFGFFSSWFLPSFSVIRELNSPAITATALGFMNALNMVGGAAGQPFVGFLLDLFWQGKMEQGVRVYSLDTFHSALIALPVMLALSLVFILFIRETHCKPVE